MLYMPGHLFQIVANIYKRVAKLARQTVTQQLTLGCPKMTKVLKCYAPYAFSGAKFQVFLENGHEIDVG